MGNLSHPPTHLKISLSLTMRLSSSIMELLTRAAGADQREGVGVRVSPRVPPFSARVGFGCSPSLRIIMSFL